MPIIVAQEDEHIHRVPDTWNFRVILPINPSCRISIAEVYPIRLPNCLQHKVLERQHFGMTRDNVLPTFVRENNLQPGWVLNIVRHSVSTRVVVISLEPHTQFQHSSIEESIQRRFIRGTLTGSSVTGNGQQPAVEEPRPSTFHRQFPPVPLVILDCASS